MELGGWITIRQVKERIQTICGVPVNAQSLFYNGRLLPDQYEAATCGLVNNSHVQLLFPTSAHQNPSRPQPPKRSRQEQPSSAAASGGGEGPTRSPPSKRRTVPGQKPPPSAAAGRQLPETGGAGVGSAIRVCDSSGRHRRESDVTRVAGSSSSGGTGGGEDLLRFERGLEILENEADSCLVKKQGSDVTSPASGGSDADWSVLEQDLQALENNTNTPSSRRQIQWSDVISPTNSPPASGWSGEDLPVSELDLQVLAGNNIFSPSPGGCRESDVTGPTNSPPPPSGANDAHWPWSIGESDVETLENNIESGPGHPQGMSDVTWTTMKSPTTPAAGAIDADWSITELELLEIFNSSPAGGQQGSDVGKPTFPPPSGANNPDFSVLGNDADPSLGHHRGTSDVTIPTNPPPPLTRSYKYNPNFPIFGPHLRMLGHCGVTVPITSPQARSSNPNSWIGDGDLQILTSNANSSSPGLRQPGSKKSVRSSSSGKMVVMVLPKDGKLKIPVEVRASERVKELRKKLERLHIHLPPDGYFFIHKQSVMEEEMSFFWNGVVSGNTIEIFNGCVTSGSPQ